MLAKRCIIFCAVSITCTTDAALLFFNHSYRERIHALVPNANGPFNGSFRAPQDRCMPHKKFLKNNPMQSSVIKIVQKSA